MNRRIQIGVTSCMMRLLVLSTWLTLGQHATIPNTLLTTTSKWCASFSPSVSCYCTTDCCLQHFLFLPLWYISLDRLEVKLCTPRQFCCQPSQNGGRVSHLFTFSFFLHYIWYLNEMFDHWHSISLDYFCNQTIIFTTWLTYIDFNNEVENLAKPWDVLQVDGKAWPISVVVCMQILACANKNRAQVLEMSIKLGFLTGQETKIMLDAHTEAAFVIGVPFQKPGPFDFGSSDMPQRVVYLGPTMLKYRLTPPPDEGYSLHRKLSGAFCACKKLGAVVRCREMFMQVFDRHKFSDKDEPKPGRAPGSRI